MLQDMGYERESASYALRVTGNSLEHACTYLLSNPNPRPPRELDNPSMRIGIGNMFSSGTFGRQNVPLASQSSESSHSSQFIQEASRMQQALDQIMMAS